MMRMMRMRQKRKGLRRRELRTQLLGQQCCCCCCWPYDEVVEVAEEGVAARVHVCDGALACEWGWKWERHRLLQLPRVQVVPNGVHRWVN